MIKLKKRSAAFDNTTIKTKGERNMYKTIDEIETRKAEIRNLLDSNAEDIDIQALNKEVDGLEKRANEIRDNEALKTELRNKVAASKAVGTPLVKAEEKMDKRTYTADSAEFRTAWLKELSKTKEGYRFGTLTKEEREAFTFLTSNTPNLVPTVIQNRIVELVKSMAPIYDDATKTSFTEGFSIPRHRAIVQGDAAVTNEGAANDDEKDTFDLLTLTGVEIKKHVEISRKMKFQSIDAFESWVTEHIAKRIAVAKEKRIIAQLDTTTYGIAAANVLTSQTYAESTFRAIFAKIAETGAKVIYANNNTIWNGIYGIQDDNKRPIFTPDSTGDPTVQGRVYGAVVKQDENLTDNVIYVGVPASVLANNFDDLAMMSDVDATTWVTTVSGYTLFDAGLENPLAFVKATFTA